MLPNLLGLTYIAALVLLSHFFGELLPRTWFDWKKAPFASFSFEKNGELYDKIHIKKWKKKMPDLSRLMKYMTPKTVSFRDSSKDIDWLLRELCVAETVHVALIVASFGIFLIVRSWFSVLLCALYALGNIPFILIQRYNRPHLAHLYARVVEKEEKQKKEKDSIL